MSTINQNIVIVKTVIVKTHDLQNPKTLEYYRAQGFQWIRREDQKHYNFYTREPTIGCIAELSTHRENRSAHLDSARAKKLIKTQNYFTNSIYI
jgi:hypothetical protein